MKGDIEAKTKPEKENWKAALSPNYQTNKNYLYPYSELPYLGTLKLVKIPVCLTNLIKHVDYLGEGRIETESGIIGFHDCYNVSYEYRLVSSGPDEGRRIPNRIPFLTGTGEKCSTQNYIKDNSVLTVTVTIAHYFISESCAQDIARIVNSEKGKVILYGYDSEYNKCDLDEIIEFLSYELMMKQLFYCPNYLLPEHLQLSAYKRRYKAFLNLNDLKKELYNHVSKGDYEAAIIVTECMRNVYCCTALSDVVNKLLENRDKHVMVYACKLWNSNARDVVCKHFPLEFKLIFNGDCMMIINKQYDQALKLCGDGGDLRTEAWGDNHFETTDIKRWKIIPCWDNDDVLFKIYHVVSDMYLTLGPTIENKQVWGSKNSKDYAFLLQPLLVNGRIAFTILNCEYEKRLKLSEDILDSDGGRYVLAHKDVSENDKTAMWILAPWQHLDGNNESDLSAHKCMHKNSSIVHPEDL